MQILIDTTYRKSSWNPSCGYLRFILGFAFSLISCLHTLRFLFGFAVRPQSCEAIRAIEKERLDAKGCLVFYAAYNQSVVEGNAK